MVFGLVRVPGQPLGARRHGDDRPVNNTYAWYGEEEQARLTEILDTYGPRNEQEQALLDILRAAQREAAG